MKDLSKEILDKIKEDKIQPTARWKFLLKDSMIWSLGGFSLIIGSLASSVVIYMFQNNDWKLYMHLTDSLFKYVFMTLPYFWLILLAFFIVVIDYNIKNTKKGYKINLTTLVLATVCISILAGAFLYNIGVGKAIDDKLAHNISIYDKYLNKDNQRMRMWMRPEKGLLMGVIITVENEKNFRISDFRNKIWNVFVEDTFFIPPEVNIKVGNGVKVLGVEKETSIVMDTEEKNILAKMLFPITSMDMLKRHPDVKKEMRDRPQMPPKEIFELFKNNIEYKQRAEKARIKFEMDKMEKMNVSCELDSECQLPFVYAIRSNCPFEAKCINNSCNVMCKHFSTEIKAVCSEDSDCDCSDYSAKDFDKCMCIEDTCSVIVK